MPFLIGHPFRFLAVTAQITGLAHVFLTYGFNVGYGQGASMLPTFLVDNEIFIISKHYRRGRDVKVGDCVSYGIPVAPGEDGLKRVLGMPGDYVLLNSPDARNDDMIQVPKGHCYIVGDNLPWSRDSRDFGPLPLALVRGKIVYRVNFSGWNPFKWFVPFENGLKPVDIQLL